MYLSWNCFVLKFLLFLSHFQVRERAEEFFTDLCKLCLHFSEEEQYTPAKIKRRHGGSLGRHSRQGSKRLQVSGRSQSFCGSANMQTIINEISLDPEFDDDEDENENIVSRKVCEGSNYISMQTPDNFSPIEGTVSDFPYRECYQSGSDDSNISSDVTNGSTKETTNSDSSSPPSCQEHEWESDSTLSGSGNNSVPFFIDRNEISPNSDTIIPPCPSKRSADELDSSSYSNECPNVSLSLSPDPRRFSSISSISSGRNSSFDEHDIPVNAADILVVSHGGFIKECLQYFVETLDCTIPGMKGHALKVCPNCSVSKFNISVDETTGRPSLTCVTIHDKDHLIGFDMAPTKAAF